ncbi:hypothetical protein T459_08738 [Capsicum annuum]|uniref:AAA+ ATPase domain-containing protein n=1 Tax=Capsicum annuum TaxID=4072 RepID=A0A2G2ZXB8_CAPAN|nr:hypothetical protein T459_08738 [Capsicum annuum]
MVGHVMRRGKDAPIWRCERLTMDGFRRDAISKALSSKDVFLLHGPPGTGKTTTVVEIILQEVERGSKILACAASNIAVDNIVERLVPHRVKLVRLGHPARMLPQVLDSALDAQALNGKLLKAKDRNAKRDIRRELKSLSREERKRQQLAVADVIKNADVVLTTLTGALTKKLDGLSFDVIIIDEAAQALEIACWIALLKRLFPRLEPVTSWSHGSNFTSYFKARLREAAVNCCCWNERDAHSSIFYLLFNEVFVHFNLLCSVMLNWIMGNAYDNFIVTVQLHWQTHMSS